MSAPAARAHTNRGISRTQVVILEEQGEIACHILFCSARQLRQWLTERGLDVTAADSHYAIGEIGPFGVAKIRGGNTALLRYMPFALALSDAEGHGYEFDLLPHH